MASIKKTSNGTYTVRWRGNGRQYRKTFARHSDAERHARDVETQKDRGQHINPEGGRIAVAEWTAEWHQGRLNLRPSTEARDRIYIDRYINEHLGNKQLRHVTPQVIRAWVATLNQSYAPATTRKAFQLLSAALNQAVTDRLIATNPATGTPLPQTQTPTHRYLELPELHHLAETINPRFRAFVYTGALAGLRPGELAALQPSNLDLPKQRLTVTHTATEISGVLTYSEPKTKASHRTIAIGAQLTDILGQHLDTYGDNVSYIHIPHVPDVPGQPATRTPQGKRDTNPGDVAHSPMSPTSPKTVFTAPDGGPLRLGNFRRRIWRPAVQESVGVPMRIHDLRHTAAALAIAQGVHPRVLQERLGHRDIQTTFNTYGGLLSGYDDGIADALDEAFRASL